jgi:hypothetical protein
MQQGFNVVTKFTSIYDNKSVIAFTKKCFNSALPMMRANMVHVGNNRKRQFFSLKEEYQGTLLLTIVEITS